MRTYLVVGAVAAGFLVFKPFPSNQRPLAIPEAAAGKSETAPRPVKDNVVAYHTRDERMNAAKDQARRTMPRFLGLLAENAPGTYAIKFPLTQNGATEHIWLQVDAHRNGMFSGRIANNPVNGSRHRMGDRLTVPAAQVEDWSVTDRDVILGGYTARVAIADLPEDKAQTLAKRFRD